MWKLYFYWKICRIVDAKLHEHFLREVLAIVCDEIVSFLNLKLKISYGKSQCILTFDICNLYIQSFNISSVIPLYPVLKLDQHSFGICNPPMKFSTLFLSLIFSEI